MPGLYSITPFTLLDYPGEMACIVWIAGCNMRCRYCHNPDIVLGKGEKEDAEILDFLKSRTGRLGAVVFSGGEATLYQGLPGLMRKVKEMGFKIKLDTNGSRPEVLRGLLAENLVDYVAMDYKSPPEKAEKIVGTKKLWEPFRESLKLMIGAAAGEGGPAFEVRTTIHPDLLNALDVAGMIEDLDAMGYRGIYYLQLVQATGEKTIGNVGEPLCDFDRAKLPEPKGFKIGFRNFKN